jgi:SAM-dependent methyltransferase
VKIPYAWSRYLPPKLFARLRMRGDWDLRARENAMYYIDCGHGEDSGTFWESGVADVERLVLRGVELGPGASVLEIGCGMGRLLRPFVGRASRIIGFDISGEMIARARQSLPAVPQVELHATDGSLRPVADGTVDFVYSFIVFQHIPIKAAIERYVREARRVLRPGGLFRFQIDGRLPDARVRLDSWNGVRWGADEVASLIAAAGLRVLEITAPGTQYTWVTAIRDPEGNPHVRHRPKAWRADAVEALARRLGLETGAAARVVAGQTSVRELAAPFLDASSRMKPEAYVAVAYELLLGRPADPEGLRFYVREIQSGIDRGNVVDCLISSAEFDDRYRA